MWLSLGGSMLCVVLMFVISWGTALLTLGAILALYLIVSYQKPGIYIDLEIKSNQIHRNDLFQMSIGVQVPKLKLTNKP